MSDWRDKTTSQRHEAILVNLARLEARLRELARMMRVKSDLSKRGLKHATEAYYAGMADAYYAASSHVAEAYRTAEMAGVQPGDTFSNQT